MVHWDLPRAPSSIALLARLGAERGVPVQTSLRGTGIEPHTLHDPRAEVDAAQELAVIANLLDALGEAPGLGLLAGARYHVTTYGIWGFALISSATLRSAVDVGLRHVDLTFALCRIQARVTAGEILLVLDAGDVPPALRRFVIERDAAAIHTLGREIYGSLAPTRRVSLAFPAPQDDALSSLSAVLGITPTFGAPENAVAFDAALLDEPLPQASELTSALAVAQCRDLLNRRRARTGLAGQVREALFARLADPLSADEVAASLHVSGRTLQRRLAEEGTSFRELLNEVRERSAEELLVADGLPVADVARRLGYVEISSFSQAFRRWKGVGPRQFRKHAQAARGLQRADHLRRAG